MRFYHPRLYERDRRWLSPLFLVVVFPPSPAQFPDKSNENVDEEHHVTISIMSIPLVDAQEIAKA